MKKLGITLLLIVLTISFLPKESSALTIAPPTMEFQGKRGEAITDVVKLYNETSNQIILTSEVRDFQPLNEKGAPNFLPPAEKDDLSKISNWISVEKNRVVLGPNERKNILFTINVPSNAEPGGHFAGILWSTSGGNNNAVNISSKTGTLVLVNIAGQIKEEARLIEFSTDKKIYNNLPTNFLLRFENLGNVYLKPIGEIKIQNTWGKEVASLDINEGLNNALPRSIREFNVAWQKENLLTLGKYKATVNISYGHDNKNITAQKTFWIFPWKIIVVFLIGLLTLVLVILIGIKKYNKWLLKKYGNR